MLRIYPELAEEAERHLTAIPILDLEEGVEDAIVEGEEIGIPTPLFTPAVPA